MYWFNTFFLALVLIVSSCNQKEQEAEKPIRRDLAEVVYASGNVYTESEYRIFANVQGYITDIPVNEGDSVNRGTTLVKLSGPNRESESTAAMQALLIARENVGKNSPGLRLTEERAISARLKAQNDANNLDRYTGLLKEGAISKAEFDRVKLQAETSEREAKAAEAQWELQKNNSQLELSNAMNRYTQSQNLLRDGAVVSALDGRVIELYKKVGDFIHQNEAIGLVGGGRPIARLNVDEADLSRVQVGQKVWIQLDAMPGKTLEARVLKIYPKLSKAEQSFRVDAEFSERLETPVYGLNLEANIVVREAKNVLCIPRKFLSTSDSLTVKRNGEIQRIKITKGAEDLSWVEIVSGLEETDELLTQ